MLRPRRSSQKWRDDVSDKLLTSTDAVGKLASIPVVVQIVNAVNNTPIARKVMDSVLGVHEDRVLPEYTSARFRGTARPGFVVSREARQSRARQGGDSSPPVT